MRTSNFVAVFVALWVCVWTQSQPEGTTGGHEIVTLDDFKLGEFFTTEKNEEESTGVRELAETKRNVTAESLVDRVVDLAIKRIKEKTTGPIKLSDEVKQFNRTFIIVPIKGEVILYNGLLNGVNTISRTGKTTFETKSGHIFVNLTVEFDELKFTYDFQTNIYKLSTDGVCKGGLTKLVANVGLQLKLTEQEIQLTYLKLITAKTLKIQLDSSKFKDKVINYVLKTITTVFKTVLLTQLEKELQTYIGTVIHF